MENFLENKFKLSENKTTIKTEVLAGLATFMTMSYILAVNPQTLADAGMDPGGVFTATIIASVLGTLIMSLFANYPFVLSAGMGVNAFFTYSVVVGMGYPWQVALTAIFFEGLILILLTFLQVRVSIMNAIPRTLRTAITVGIGLYITLIGLNSSGIVMQGDSTILQMGSLTDPNALVTVFGLLLTGILLARKVNAAILIGIVGSTVLAIILGVSSLPESLVAAPPSIGKVSMALDFSQVDSIDFWIVVFTFVFSDVLDTAGTMIGLASNSNMLDEKGRLPRANKALIADGIATSAGAMLGTSTIKTFAESATGMAQGARTGLSSLVAAVGFLICLFLFPIFQIIPASATAPALILVGLMMMNSIVSIDFSDYTESLPAFLTIIMMPFGYSIVEGIIAGIISYVVMKVFTGKFKDPSPLMYILALVFVVRVVLG